MAPDASGLEDDIVISYRAVVALAGRLTRRCTMRAMSDYYKAEGEPRRGVRASAVRRGACRDVARAARVRPRTQAGKETLVGEAAFRTAARVTPALGNPLLSVDFSTGSHADAVGATQRRAHRHADLRAIRSACP